MMVAASQTRRGFTLMEVVIAMLMIGVLLPAVMGAITTCMRAESRSRHIAEATELAQERLYDEILTADITKFTGTGDFGQDFSIFRWQSTYQEASYGTYEVTVTVTWLEGNDTHSVKMSTLYYDTSSTSTTTGGA